MREQEVRNYLEIFIYEHPNNAAAAENHMTEGLFGVVVAY